MEQLVWTRSEDDLQLEGIAFRPPAAAEAAEAAAGAGETAAGPAVVLVHGLGSRFYSHSVSLVGRGLAARGLPAVSGNNRGHDYGAYLSRSDGSLILGGAAWEDVREAPRDIAAWVDFACRHFGVGRVALCGHSLGGLKVALYQAQRRDPRVAGLALLSPPFSVAPWWKPELLPLARAWVEEGRGAELLPEPLGWLGRVSARTYLSRDPALWPADLAELLRGIACPVLACYGSVEDVGGPAELARLREAVGAETHLLEGADHNYTARWDEVAGLVANWLRRVAR